jgi:ankyrin repeat protein
VNTEVQGQMTALLWATIAGHKDVVEILLQQPGIQVNAADMWGRTPLVNASTMVYTEIVRMLLEAGADIRDTLIMSSGNGHIEIVKMLLKEGADVNETDEDGMTALMMASEWGHKYVVKILLAQEGINVNLWNNEGETALILASKEGHLEIVKMLLKAGADVNAVANDEYDTAITLANGNGHDEIVELLIRKGATIPEGDEDQNIRDKREEILKQKTMAMEVMSRGITRDKEARLLKHGQASVEMGRKVAEYLGGKRKTKKSTRKKRKN